MSGASGRAKEELESATGVTAGEAAQRAQDLLQLIRSIDGLAAGVAVWTDLVLREGFLAGVDAEVGALPDQAKLDAWAQDRTNGLIKAFPLLISPDSLLVLASIVSAKAKWTQPFSEVWGQWMGAKSAPGFLSRRSNLDRSVALLSVGGAVFSRVAVASRSGLSVILLAGDRDASPGQVISAGLDDIAGLATRIEGAQLKDGDAGGCLSATVETAIDPDPVVSIQLPAFEVSSEHDLLVLHDLFGLTSAMDMDDRDGHFPDISATPLAIGAAAQSARMLFEAEGFKAAAVTAMGMAPTAASPSPQRQVKRLVVNVDHDRPFAFIVVEPQRSLVSFAGWFGPSR